MGFIYKAIIWIHMVASINTESSHLFTELTQVALREAALKLKRMVDAAFALVFAMTDRGETSHGTQRCLVAKERRTVVALKQQQATLFQTCFGIKKTLKYKIQKTSRSASALLESVLMSTGSAIQIGRCLKTLQFGRF